MNAFANNKCRQAKRLRSLSIVFLLPFVCHIPDQASAADTLYDVVIVGGGLAGLSAAYELKGYDSLILEKEDYLGGRITTRKKNGISYDMGPPSGYCNVSSLPLEVHIPDHFSQARGIALSHKGKIIPCGNIRECILQLGSGQQELEKTLPFMDSACPDKLFEYYPEGNRLIVDSLKKTIASKIELSAEVVSIEDFGNHVVTVYRRAGKVKRVLSKAVVITTPAPVARRMLGRIDPECLSFLESVKYGKITVVAIALKDVELKNFSCLMTVDAPSGVICSKRPEGKKRNVLLVYYGDRESRLLENDSDAAIVDRTIDMIRTLAIGDFSGNNILFTDIKRWDYAGTLTTEPVFKEDQERHSRPSKRVFLAGDYVRRDQSCPYGMEAAVVSGKNAALKARDLLRAAGDCNKECFEVVGITMTIIPDHKSIAYLSKIQPAIFGLGNNPAGLQWIEDLDQRAVFGYDFFKFYGSDSFKVLLEAATHIKNTIIVGYCPVDKQLTKKEFSDQIKLLRKLFPDKKILIGPCVDLFAKVNSSKNFPDLLGFEVFEENFDDYLNGKFDKAISETLGRRIDVGIIVTVFKENINFEKLEKVLRKAKSQKLSIGYTFNGNEKLFDFILQHLCF